jgi:hypothetical protein
MCGRGGFLFLVPVNQGIYLDFIIYRFTNLTDYQPGSINHHHIAILLNLTTSSPSAQCPQNQEFSSHYTFTLYQRRHGLHYTTRESTNLNS